jgi:hypothetical protein
VYRLAQKGDYGCKTVVDIPPAYLLLADREEIIKNMI